MSVQIDISEIQTVEQKLMLRQTELLKSIKANIQFLTWVVIISIMIALIIPSLI